MDAHQHRGPIPDPADVIDRADISQDTDPTTPDVLVELPVRVTRPVRTQDLAVDLASSRSWTLTTTPEPAVEAQDSRARAILVSATEDFYVGTSSEAVRSGTAAIWPAGVPLTVGRSKVYVAVAGSGTTIFSVLNFTLG